MSGPDHSLSENDLIHDASPLLLLHMYIQRECLSHWP